MIRIEAILAFALLPILAACSRSSAQPAPPPAPAASEHELHLPPVGPTVSTGKLFGDFCVTEAECASGVCFHKRLKGPNTGPETRDAGPEPVEHDGYCSLGCNQDSDCPVPPTRGKCGARGMCKRPD